MTRIKFHTEDPQMLGATVKMLSRPAALAPGICASHDTSTLHSTQLEGLSVGSTATFPIQSQMNPVHSFVPYFFFFKMQFNSASKITVFWL